MNNEDKIHINSFKFYDRDELEELTEQYYLENEQLLKENQELKKQLENCYCNRTDCSSRIRNSKQYDSLVQKTEKQQKDFIEWLEKMWEETQDIWYIKILNKYKEIIGGKYE